MSFQGGKPENKNQLSPLGFQFRVKKLPSTNFFVTRTNLPGLVAQPPTVATPFNRMPMAYDKIEFNDLVLTFKVDEDLTNFLEIYDWMIGVGFPTAFNERKHLEASTTSRDSLFADGTLTVMTSKKNPNIQFDFKNLIPTSLSDLEFTTTDMDVNYIEATVSFKYLNYTVARRKS